MQQKFRAEDHAEPPAKKRVRIDENRTTVREFITPKDIPPTYLNDEDYRRRRNEDNTPKGAASAHGLNPPR